MTVTGLIADAVPFAFEMRTFRAVGAGHTGPNVCDVNPRANENAYKSFLFLSR